MNSVEWSSSDVKELGTDCQLKLQKKLSSNNNFTVVEKNESLRVTFQASHCVYQQL